MTAVDPGAQRLEPAQVAGVIELLEGDSLERMLAHQYVLAALDRGEHSRVVVWPPPPDNPVAVLYDAPSGTITPAGDPEGAKALAEVAATLPWRVLVGEAAISNRLLDDYPAGLFRRGPNAREQRFMVADLQAQRPPAPEGFRLARHGDVEDLTELAARLHVEDLMGPPIARAALGGVRSRMVESVQRGDTWVVERDGRAVAKVDLSLRSDRRGAQIAGVYVEEPYREMGLAAGTVAGVVDRLLDEGQAGVTLHARTENVPAIAAYQAAGFVDRGAWTLALR